MMATMDATDLDLRRDGARIDLILSGRAFVDGARRRSADHARAPFPAIIGLVAALAIGSAVAGVAWRRMTPLPERAAHMAPRPVLVAPVPAPIPNRAPPSTATTSPPVLVQPSPAVESTPVSRPAPVHHVVRHRPAPARPARGHEQHPARPRTAASHATARPKPVGAIADPLTGAALRAAQEADARRARDLNRRELERISGRSD